MGGGGRPRLGAGTRAGVGVVANRPVLDSDVLIDYLRGTGAGVDLVRSLRGTLGYWITAVTAFELALGRAYGIRPAPVDALISVPTLTLNREAGVRGGTVLRELRGRGDAIDIRDAMQAGICLDADLPLVTRNLSHFARVPRLRVAHPDDWPRGE